MGGSQCLTNERIDTKMRHCVNGRNRESVGMQCVVYETERERSRI